MSKKYCAKCEGKCTDGDDINYCSFCGTELNNILFADNAIKASWEHPSCPFCDEAGECKTHCLESVSHRVALFESAIRDITTGKFYLTDEPVVDIKSFDDGSIRSGYLKYAINPALTTRRTLNDLLNRALQKLKARNYLPISLGDQIKELHKRLISGEKLIYEYKSGGKWCIAQDIGLQKLYQKTKNS